MAFGVAGLSGVAAALAFPPFEAGFLVWVALVPLLWIVRSSRSVPRAALVGWFAGSLFYFLILGPLASAYLWSGWASVAGGALEEAVGRQRATLQGLRVVLALGAGATWALFAGVLRWLPVRRPGTMALAAPFAWVLAERLRILTIWDFEWGLLGHALADSPLLRQAASLGGVGLLSALVVAGNTSILLAFSRRDSPARWRAVAMLVGCLALTLGWGRWSTMRAENLGDRQSLRVGVLQFHQPRYSAGDFLENGLERGYARLIPQALGIEPDLLVLPESISARGIDFGAERRPDGSKPVAAADAWNRWFRARLEGTDSVVVLGVDTLDEDATYNSLVAWTAEGLAGVYDKTRPVPFAEYRPRFWGPVSAGRYDYTAGARGQTIRIGDLVLGAFICQEVQFSGLIREAVRDGAGILISGGNDGVFADPAVAEAHAEMARIRAVESGRYLLRAMKTGVSAIVDPLGREIERSQGAEPVYLWSEVAVLEHRTPYVRFGDWPLTIASLAALALAAWPRLGELGPESISLRRPARNPGRRGS